MATKPLHTVENMLPSLKDKINKFDHCRVEYRIPCLDCAGVDVGETGRSFQTRRKEHQRDIKLNTNAQLTSENLERKSALVKHVYLSGHQIDWESSTILAIKSDNKKRRFLDFMRKTNFASNLSVFITESTKL